ncbi:MAG TPA: aminoacetone oxidase family FAD-binding enzyme [Armatimonadota bacterium]|nr:aminoacetone oxidase family FAD-binding enzyme [Armatimonadota bacterium]
MDVVVIGAGAAGLASAIWAGRSGADTLVLDSQVKPGAKILVSGGGRCNVTNANMSAERFNSGAREFVARVLDAFPLADTVRWFSDLGVPLLAEADGRMFPKTNSSRTVLDALQRGAESAGVRLLTGQNVTGIRPGNPFQIVTKSGEFPARSVIICCGGLALPKSGSTGAGYVLASRLGHTMVATTPALTPLIADPPIHAELSGISLPAVLTLREGAKTIAQSRGSLLFTHEGYSGPCALNISRHAARAQIERRDFTMSLRILPEREFGDLSSLRKAFAGRRSGVNALSEVLPRRVAQWVCRYAGVEADTVSRALSRNACQRLWSACADLVLPPLTPAGYRTAEVTAGGVRLDEVDPATMMSRIVPGLFFGGGGVGRGRGTGRLQLSVGVERRRGCRPRRRPMGSLTPLNLL